MYLDEILAQHRELARLDERNLKSLINDVAALPRARGFESQLRRESTTKLAVIAEIKRRSPSRGALNPDLVASDVATQYSLGGASCLSVLTDENYFGGSVSDLQSARAAIDLPVLRKDFTVSLNDVCDARLMGADCVLLIVAALSIHEITEFKKLADELGLDALVEVHDEPELEIALKIGATLIGVNQRDLKTFEVDHQRAVRMASQMPSNVVRIAESGVRTQADAKSLRDAGYHAVLVGESLVTAQNIATAVGDLRV